MPAANIIGADGCVLLGEFNNWNLEEGYLPYKDRQMARCNGSGTGSRKEYQYRYLLSNGRWVNDDAEKIVSEMSGYPVENCIIRVPADDIKLETVEKPKTVKSKAQPNPKPVVVLKEDLTKVEGIGRKI